MADINYAKAYAGADRQFASSYVGAITKQPITHYLGAYTKVWNTIYAKVWLGQYTGTWGAKYGKGRALILASLRGRFMVYRVTGLGPGLPDYRVTGLGLP